MRNPDHGRPFAVATRLKANPFRSIVGHLHVESPNFASNITGKALWGYGKSQFYFHLAQNLRAQKPPISALPHEPGRELFVDFAGDTLCYVNILKVMNSSSLKGWCIWTCSS